MSNDLTQPSDRLFHEIRQLIDTAKQRAAVAINAEITLLYWQVGKRIQTEVLQGQRGEYGKQIIVSLSIQLTQTCGKGWGEKHLRHCLRLAETFPDEQILSALRRQLSWTHIKTLMYFDDPLIPNHKSKATDRASRMEAQPTIEAMTDLVISERRFLTKSRKSCIFLGKANRNPCFRCSQTRSIGFNWGECAG